MAILHHSSADCPAKPPTAGLTGLPVAGSLTFKHLVTIIAWVCFGVSVLLWVGLVGPHLRRYAVPNQQRQIIRVVTTPPVFAIFAVISLHAYKAADYLEPLSNLYEAFALASLFLLHVHYVTPEVSTRDHFFGDLERKSRSGGIVSGGSLEWFRRTWRIVFLYVVIYTILIIIQEITQATGTYCSTSSKPKFAHVWLQALQLIATIYAVSTIIRFQRRLKTEMTGRKALSKLIIFKLFVFLTVLQHFIFGILESKVTGGPKVTYDDITIGVPAVLICIESVIFMVAFYYPFTAKEYKEVKQGSEVRYSMGRALLDVLNPMDLLSGIGQAFGVSYSVV